MSNAADLVIHFDPKNPTGTLVVWRGTPLGLLQGVEVKVDLHNGKVRVIAYEPGYNAQEYVDGKLQPFNVEERNKLLLEMEASGIEVLRNVHTFDEEVERRVRERHNERMRIKRDPWRAGAAQMLNKGWDEVTAEERRAFKHAFFNIFSFLGPKLVFENLETGFAMMRANPDALDAAYKELETYAAFEANEPKES